MSPSTAVSPGFRPSWPATKTRSPGADRLVVRRALERRRRGLGAEHGLLHLVSFGRRCGQWAVSEARARATPSALKIASSTWSVSSPSIRRTCTVSPAASASACEEAGGEIGAEAARSRQVGVGGDERPARRSTTTIASASSAGTVAEAVGAVGETGRDAPGRARRPRHRPRPRGRPARSRARGRSRPARGELGEQVVEHRHAGRDVRRARPLGLIRAPLTGPPARSIGAEARRRSSIRS